MNKHPETTTIRGAMAGLGVVAIAGAFAFGFVPVLTHTVKATQAPEPLSSWSIDRIAAEIGEYDQKVPDCAGFVPGVNGYVVVKTDALGQFLGAVIVCKP